MTRAASSATRIDTSAIRRLLFDSLLKPVAHDLALNRHEVLHRAAARKAVHSE